jgi:hypothetical protein
VVAYCDGCPKFDNVFIGIRRLGSERSHRRARKGVPCLKAIS